MAFRPVLGALMTLAAFAADPSLTVAGLRLTPERWNKSANLDKFERYARQAAAQGAQVICFQELFYGPYFCQVQEPEYYQYTEYIPDGPTTQRFQAIAKETGMVLVLPMYEIVQPGLYYNTAAVIDAGADGVSVIAALSLAPDPEAATRERRASRPSRLRHVTSTTGRPGTAHCSTRW